MKTPMLILALALIAGCSAQTEEATAQPVTHDANGAPATAAMAQGHSTKPANAVGMLATATGVVTAIDAVTHKVTIAHDPVPALGWSAMTMGFSANDVDLTGIQVGDKVSFEFTSEGMKAAISKIARQ